MGLDGDDDGGVAGVVEIVGMDDGGGVKVVCSRCAALSRSSEMTAGLPL